MLGKFSRIVGVASLVVSGLLVACSPHATQPDQVTLQLNWYHEAEFAGYYVAEAQGFYADENIAITILEGSLEGDPSQLLIDRSVDFAVLPLAAQKHALAAGQPLVTTMAVFQIPPLVAFALSDSGISSPRDLVGRRVAIKNEIWRRIIHDMLTNAGVDPAEIIEVEVESNALELLYNREVDVWTGYVHDEPAEARLAGYDVNLIFPADYGVGSYEGLLAVHQETLDQNPDGSTELTAGRVARFVRASLLGWQYAIEHPAEAAEIVARWQPDKSLEFHQLARASGAKVRDDAET
ncbi:MAG: hypothetical protein CVU38_07320 [Chloroflexi bacterium HGW-Chloroflexi-1]|nr:MAG: hypothetical protein CVU38_07320 [Chloroflexi bacterium HGW-Chloroflexi-1]